MKEKNMNNVNWITATTNPEKDGVEGYYEYMPDVERLPLKCKHKFDSHNERFRKRYGVYPNKIGPEFGTVTNVRLINITKKEDQGG